MITLKHQEWRLIKERLATDYGRGIVLLQSKAKRELGFTVRHHKDYPDSDWTHAIDHICLDFYDDAAETMFRLKYL